MADLWESMTAAAAELVAFAGQQGIDLAPLCDGSPVFTSRGRMIFLWRVDGAVGYNMQGPIQVLPQEFKQSAGSFYGMWHESGWLPDVERAFEFLVAWLLVSAEVDQLPVPERKRHRWGIG